MVYRKFVVLLACMLVALAAAAQDAPDPDKIIEEHLKASGGREAIEAVKDRTIKAKLFVMGMAGSITLHAKYPNKGHQLVEVDVNKIENWFDGEKGHRSDPMSGDVVALSPKEVEEAQALYHLEPLLVYKDRGQKARFVGMTKEGDRELTEIELSGLGGKDPTRLFFDSDFMLVKQISPLASWEGQGTSEMRFSDYRDVKGLKMPFKLKRITSQFEVDMEVETVETNTGLDDSLFVRPAPKAK